MISACISEGVCASRQIWSFARDNGLPGSSWLARVSEGFNILVRAILTTVVIVALIFPDQHRFDCGTERHKFSRRTFNSGYLPHRRRLLYMESTQ